MAKPTPNREFWRTKRRNTFAFVKYYNKLMEYAISVFKWTGLPDTVDERYLELALFATGSAIFYNDPALGYVGLRANANGSFNQYGTPNRRTAYGYAGYQNDELDAENSVLIYNDVLHTNSMLVVEEFAERLYRLDRIIDINTEAQRTPIMLVCDEHEQLTVENAYKKYADNDFMIATTKGFRPDSIKTLTTGAPYVADKLYNLKQQIWNEALTFLGIANVNYEKGERLITDEVMRGQGGTITSRFSKLIARQQACDKINKMFGLNVWCEFRDIDELSTNIDDNVVSQKQEEGVDSGEVHNDSQVDM